MKHTYKIIISNIFIITIISGCASSCPKDIFKSDIENSLEVRELQSRSYNTTNQEKILTASSTVLQDMGYTLDSCNEDFGFLVASKYRSAINKAELFAAISLTFIGALVGNPNGIPYTKDQRIKVSIIVNLNGEKNKSIVRVSFQRVIWNSQGLISKTENIKDPEIYQGFFDKLSKSIFLEDYKI